MTVIFIDLDAEACGCCVRVWCRYCGKFHKHGKPSDLGTPHRVCHCLGETPYSTTGYVLTIVDRGYYAANPPQKRSGR
jgi:hypothetical protein